MNGLYHAIVGGFDGGNRTIGIPGKFFDGGRAAIAATPHVLLVMVEEETTALELNNARVICKRSTISLIHDYAAPFPGTGWGIASGVGNFFWYAMRGIYHVVGSVTLVNPGAFGIFGWFTRRRKTRTHIGLMNSAIKRNHVFIKFRPIKARISPIKVGLIVVVNPYGRVNVVAVRRSQMFAVQGIFEWAFGLVCHSYVNGSAATTNGHIVIVFTVPTYDLCGPVVILIGASMETFAGKDKGAAISPVHHIGGAGNTPAVHREKSTTFIVTGINADGIAKHNRSGVRGIVGLENRVFCQGHRAEPKAREYRNDFCFRCKRHNHIPFWPSQRPFY